MICVIFPEKDRFLFRLLLIICLICYPYCCDSTNIDNSVTSSKNGTTEKKTEQPKSVERLNQTIHENAIVEDTMSTKNKNNGSNEFYTKFSEIPVTGFYIFVSLGFVAILFVSYRSFRKLRLRSNRAARRYGTRGNHSKQEIQPLPAALEIDSDGDEEDHTLFSRGST